MAQRDARAWLLLAFVLTALVAMIATVKGRSGAAWFLYALLLFPVALDPRPGHPKPSS